MDDLISRQAVIDAVNSLIDRFERILSDIRESKVDDSVCGLCEYDGAFVGQSGNWCNECPGFEKDNCFKLSDKCRKRWFDSVALPSAQPMRKKGKWTIEDCHAATYQYCCSNCGAYHRARYGFCPSCGARMDGKDGEAHD